MVVKWVPGKSHHVADALSRAPLFARPTMMMMNLLLTLLEPV